MDSQRGKVLLGFLGGVLVTLGIGFVLTFLWFLAWSHHMFIIGFQWPRAGLAILIPLFLVTTGVIALIRALRHNAR